MHRRQAPVLLALLACAWLLVAASGATASRLQPPQASAAGQRATASSSSAQPAGAAVPAAGGGGSGTGPAHAAVERLFAELDRDRDNQITVEETAAYAAAAGLDWEAEGWSPQRAAAAGAAALDGADAGTTVSRQELHTHLRALLQDHGVVEWVVHGLGLPQYAPAFKANSITALDFPLLIADGGASLRDDLGVASRLHQQQILRGLKRHILGLGQLPSPPRQLECRAVNRTTVRLSWQAPLGGGHPLFHKYVLQRQRLDAEAAAAAASCTASSSPLGGGTDDDAGGGGGGGDSCAATNGGPWELVADPDDELSAWYDAPPARGTYRYRLTAWSAFGSSPHAESAAACTVRAVAKRRQPPPASLLPPAEAQAVLAAIAAARGGSVVAPRGTPGGTAATWSWSAASSAVVVALSILLKASQLQVWPRLVALCRLAAGALGGRRGALADGPSPEQQQQQQQPAEQVLELAGSGMRRVTSSRASLLSLDSGHAASDDPQQQQNGGSLRHSHSSSQLLASPSRLTSAVTGDGLSLDPAEGVDGAAVLELDAAAEALALAVRLGHHCAHPGCHRRLDRLRDMRRKLESHYCALCQRVVCLAHTRVSPHGPRGGCGLESKCVCCACFAELAPAQQAAYDRINRLPRAAGSNGGVGGSEAHAAAAAAAGPSNGDALPAAAQTSSSNSEPPAADGALLQAAAGGAAARRRWRTASAVLRALGRFRAAGREAPPR